MTFGTKLYEEYGKGVVGEAISDSFFVPNVEPGTYDLTVIDEDENELTVQFTVTESTYVIADPAVAPIDYNVSIKGYHFADSVGAVEFVLYNSTHDWDMDVYTTTDDPYNPDPAATGTDGNFTAWWEVPKDEDLVIGDYTINVTDSEEMLVQVPFSIVAARVNVQPRKALFDRGNTVQFDIANDFDMDASYLEIFDPGDILFWKTSPLTPWVKVGSLYTVPYYLQISGGNPMTLTQDATLCQPRRMSG